MGTLTMDNSTFEIIWNSARYNVFFWATHGVGLCCVLLAFACGVKGKFIPGKTAAGRLVMLGMFLAVTALATLSTGRKWYLRKEAAHTEEQKAAVANRDGANLGVSPIIGAFWASCYVVACLVASRAGYRHAVRPAPEGDS